MQNDKNWWINYRRMLGLGVGLCPGLWLGLGVGLRVGQGPGLWLGLGVRLGLGVGLGLRVGLGPEAV